MQLVNLQYTFNNLLIHACKLISMLVGTIVIVTNTHFCPLCIFIFFDPMAPGNWLTSWDHSGWDGFKHSIEKGFQIQKIGEMSSTSGGHFMKYWGGGECQGPCKIYMSVPW